MDPGLNMYSARPALKYRLCFALQPFHKSHDSKYTCANSGAEVPLKVSGRHFYHSSRYFS